MNELQRGILTLVKSAITCEPGVLPEGFSLEAAMTMIRKHQLQPLVYEGALRCGIPDATPQMNDLFRIYCKHMVRSEAQMNMVEKLYAAFEANGIDYMPLKGCNMKALYPRPELRVMGDADILIRMEQYPRIRPIVAGLGVEERQERDPEYVWHSNMLHLELHKRLFAPSNADFYAYFGDGWRLAQSQNGYRFSMGAEDGFIYQFVHYAKHYRNGGIGCRHIVDLWVYLRTHPGMDQSYIYSALEKLHLQVFYQNTIRLLKVWFEHAEDDDRTAFMTDFIFDSGSWGQKKNHILASEIRDIKQTGSFWRVKLCTIQSVLFPACQNMVERYPILRRMPWLLPVMWPVRWVDAFLFRRKNVREVQKNLQIATENNVDEYQQTLNYVGLEFHFEP